MGNKTLKSEGTIQSGLCHCGCGQPTPLLTCNRKERGLKKGQPANFIVGHWARTSKGRANGKRTIVVAQATALPDEARNAIRIAKIGSRNPNWKGDKAAKQSGRARAKTLFPELGLCADCGKPAVDRHHDNANTLDNSPRNVVALCRHCHIKRDGRIEKMRNARYKHLGAAPEAEDAQQSLTEE